MNKILVLAIGMFVFCSVSKSQSTFGFKAGVNLANQKQAIPWWDGGTPMPVETKPFLGYQVGTFYKTQILNRLWFSGEVNFSVIGSSKKMAGEGNTIYDGHEKLGYLELPLTIQYKIGKFYLGAGPSVSLKLFARNTKVGGNTYELPFYKALDAGANVLTEYTV